MKIDNSMAQQAFAAYRSNAEPARNAGSAPQTSGTSASKPQQPDTVEISAKSRQYAQALEAARTAPDSRAALVASLRAQVQDGSYQVNTDSLATAVARHVDVRA